MSLLQFLWLSLTIIVPYCIYSTSGEKAFVRPSKNETCQVHPCFTLNDYAREANQYFLDNTVFIFLSGIHQLDIGLRVDNVSNVSFIVLNKTQDDTVQVVFSPLVNITWSDCDNIVITDLVFVLSGDSASESLFSTLAFQGTTSFLSQLIMCGNGTLRSTAIRTHSSQVKISDVMVLGATSLYGAALVAFNSMLEFFGQNVFINNTAAQGGAMILFECFSTFYGNISFVNNTAISDTFPIFAHGGAIYCNNSTLSFSGTAIFLLNQATGPAGSFLANFGAIGGAIMAISSSTLTFETTSDLLFTENTATFRGGAMSATASEVSILGKALFEENIARQSGGAIEGDDNSRIYCSGWNIRFQNNLVADKLGSGGAIYSYSSDVELKKVQFKQNAAGFGGAIYCSQCSYLCISTCEFMNNTASYSGAVYIDTGTAVIFDGINHFEWNHANITGAVEAYSTNVTFSGENTFCKNNATLSSGSLSLSLSNAIMSGKLTFHKNHGVYGGGIDGILSNLTIYGTISFISNTADFQGGGLMFANGTLSIIGVLTLTNNSAVGGGGFNIRKSEVDFEGCIHYLNNYAAVYGGAIYARDSEITLRGSSSCSIFQSNVATGGSGGGIYAIDSSVYMTGEQKFIQNSAEHGGALAFSGSSKLILTEPLQASFVDNEATIDGGAIYFADTISVSQCTQSFASDPRECFIELNSNSSIQLDFIHNTAVIAGTILYGGSLDSCRLYIGGGIRSSCGNRIGGRYSDDPVDTIKKVSRILSDDSVTSEISSDPLQVCICIDNSTGSLECTDQVIKTIRGRKFTLLAVTVGQNQGIVPSSVRTSLTNDVQISAAQRIQSTGKECTPVIYRLSTDKDTTILTLFPDGPCRDTGFSRRHITIDFLPCPDGFTLDGSECFCEDRLLKYTTNCSVDDNSIERSSNTFWMGTVYNNETFEGLILHSGCPFDYCVDSPVSIKLDDLNIQCDHNHSGTLCGSCNNGYSIAFGTLHCLPCSNYHLALVVPFAVAGIILVAILLLLQLSVAIGTMNGLIFYANIIQVNRPIFFPPGETNILTVFIAWLNLDLGIETCFYDGMNIYAFTWLQFLFPFYIWFLIGLIIVVSHFSKGVARSLGKNPVAALATLLLLSYSKILRTVIVALSFTRLEYPDGSNKLVWLYDGNVPYFQRTDHFVLGAFSIITLLLLFLPYTFLLLCSHWLQAYSHWWILSWLNKIKPFMDAYHAPYKKESRYWTGFLLVVRCVLFLSFAFNALGNASVNLLAITSVTAGLVALAWVRNRVYEKLYNDILEASFILNLCIFAAATYHVKETGSSQAGLAYTSVGITLATFTSIVIYHIYLSLHQTSVGKKLFKTIATRFYIMHKLNRSKESDAPEADQENKQDSEIVEAPTTTTIELREPLLEK